MKPQKSPVFVIIALAMIVLSSLACSFSGVNLHTVSPVTVDIAVDEDTLNHQLSWNDGAHITDHCENVLDHLTRIEMHKGYIRFLGTKTQPDGSKVEGSLDLSLTAQDNALKAEITAVNIPGLDLTNRCVVEANQELDKEFSHMLTHSNDEVLFKEVVVEEGVLRMKVLVNIND